MSDEKSFGILSITIITMCYLIVDLFLTIDNATSQLISTAIGGILGITVGKAR